jgi:hypothetical protein
VEESAFLTGVVFADYENLVKTCLDFLSRLEGRRVVADAGFKIMSQVLKQIISRRLLEENGSMSY